jgi:hypothetical protein
MVEMFSPNDMLLDQTMLCEASRLLEACPQGREFVEYLQEIPHSRDSKYVLGQYGLGIGSGHGWPPSNAERLFNLSILLDGLALHDHLYVLQAELPPDAASLRLRQLLIEKDIVREMETAPYLPMIIEEFNQFFNQLL